MSCTIVSGRFASTSVLVTDKKLELIEMAKAMSGFDAWLLEKLDALGLDAEVCAGLICSQS